MLRQLVERKIEIVPTLHALMRLRTSFQCADPVLDARRFVRLGGRLLYGSDNQSLGTAYVDVEELRLMRRAGLSPSEVLAAMTSRAGEHLGLAPLGTLSEGAPADVIAVPGDARRLREDLAEPLLVTAGGRLILDPAQN